MEFTKDNMKAVLAQDLMAVEANLNEEFASDASDFNALVAPLSAAGGKRLRAQLVLLIANAGRGSKLEDRVHIAAAVEMLHLATLIHDDVLDQADIRRGESTIHTHKGNKVAILSGDYLFAKAFHYVSRMDSMEYLRIFSHVITCLVEGEFMQMEDAYRMDQGMDRYLAKTQKKTADFLEACMELGGLLGSWSPDHIRLLKAYGHALGMGFQITDDILDYRETSESTGKPVGNDLKEGLLTYPLLSIVTDQNKDQLEADVRALRHGGNSQGIIDYVVTQGGLENTLALEAKYRQDALEALDCLPDFVGKEILYKVVDGLASRKA